MQQNDRAYAANIPRYFAYLMLKGFGFGLFVSVWVIYLQEVRGLTLSQAALIDATFFVAAAFGEVPTGVVADKMGRKASMLIGTFMLMVSTIGWTFAPTMPLIMISYVAMGIGMTFLSGAEDALFYESVKRAGRENDYMRLVGRAMSAFIGALAFGSLAGGLLAEVELVLPFVGAIAIFAIVIGVVATLREPQAESSEAESERVHRSFGAIISQSVSLMRARPSLRYPMIYLALVPLASFMTEAVFLQPQSRLLGMPIAGIGMLMMAIQLVNMVASSMSDQIKTRLGEQRVLYAVPIIIICCLLLLAALQVLPALVLIFVMGFATSVLRPLVMGRVQAQVSDDVRATVISMQSLMFTVVVAICQPSLAYIADGAGLPTAYVVLAAGLSLLVALLFWMSRAHFPKSLQPKPIFTTELNV